MIFGFQEFNGVFINEKRPQEPMVVLLPTPHQEKGHQQKSREDKKSHECGHWGIKYLGPGRTSGKGQGQLSGPSIGLHAGTDTSVRPLPPSTGPRMPWGAVGKGR